MVRGKHCLPATLMSVAKAISNPPPSAVPSRAEMTGLGRSERSWIIFRAAAVNSPTYRRKWSVNICMCSLLPPSLCVLLFLSSSSSPWGQLRHKIFLVHYSSGWQSWPEGHVSPAVSQPASVEKTYVHRSTAKHLSSRFKVRENQPDWLTSCSKHSWLQAYWMQTLQSLPIEEYSLKHGQVLWRVVDTYCTVGYQYC